MSGFENILSLYRISVIKHEEIRTVMDIAVSVELHCQWHCRMADGSVWNGRTGTLWQAGVV